MLNYKLYSQLVRFILIFYGIIQYSNVFNYT